jgi:uncharacterized membrane protein
MIDFFIELYKNVLIFKAFFVTLKRTDVLSIYGSIYENSLAGHLFIFKNPYREDNCINHNLRRIISTFREYIN